MGWPTQLAAVATVCLVAARVAMADVVIYPSTPPLVPLYDDANSVTKRALDLGFLGWYPPKSCSVDCWRNSTIYCADKSTQTVVNRTTCVYPQPYNATVVYNETIENATLGITYNVSRTKNVTRYKQVYVPSINGCDIDDKVCDVPGLQNRPDYNGKACTNQTFLLIPQKQNLTTPIYVPYTKAERDLLEQKANYTNATPYGYMKTWEYGTPKPDCNNFEDPCGWCNLNYTFCEPQGMQCTRSLNDGDYFPLRSIANGQFHNYKVDALTHDSYCCKYHKHCQRNTLLLRVESCLGQVNMYVDIKPNPGPDRYLWKSDNKANSGFVQQLKFPIYHAIYYVAVYGGVQTDSGDVFEEESSEWQPLPHFKAGQSKNLYDGILGKSTYNLYASTSTMLMQQAPGCGGYINLVGSNALDKNVPDIIAIKIRWCGMSDPLGRPVTYYVYTKTFTDSSQLTSYKNSLATPCAMKLNGKYLTKKKSKTYGTNEIYSRYEETMVIDRRNYYILNIYAENDVGVGKPYTVFLSAPPPNGFDMLKETSNQIIMGVGLCLFGIVVACTMYWGKIRPAAVEEAQMAVLEERKLIEDQKQQKTRNNKLKRNRKGVELHLPGQGEKAGVV